MVFNNVVVVIGFSEWWNLLFKLVVVKCILLLRVLVEGEIVFVLVVYIVDVL